MNQGRLEVVNQELARVKKINILGISELKWMGMGEFNSYDHYIYYCGQESLITEATECTCTQCSYMMIVWTEIFLLPFVITFMLFWITLSHWSIFIDTIQHYDNNLKYQLAFGLEVFFPRFLPAEPWSEGVTEVKDWKDKESEHVQFLLETT